MHAGMTAAVPGIEALAADMEWQLLVLQQRLVTFGPAGIMRPAGAGLAVASPV